MTSSSDRRRSRDELWPYDHTSPRVYGLVSAIVEDSLQCEQITHDVYLAAWQLAADQPAPDGSVLAWLVASAHRRATAHLRAEQSVADVISLDRKRDLRSEREGTPQRLADDSCVRRCYYDAMTHTELARHLGTDPVQVRHRMRMEIAGLGGATAM